MKEPAKNSTNGFKIDHIYVDEAVPLFLENVGSLDWKKIRDTLVSPVAQDDPAVAEHRTLLKWLDENPAPEGNDSFTGMSYSDMHEELRQHYLDEIERYRWRRAGFSDTSHQ